MLPYSISLLEGKKYMQFSELHKTRHWPL